MADLTVHLLLKAPVQAKANRSVASLQPAAKLPHLQWRAPVGSWGIDGLRRWELQDGLERARSLRRLLVLARTLWAVDSSDTRETQSWLVLVGAAEKHVCHQQSQSTRGGKSSQRGPGGCRGAEEKQASGARAGGNLAGEGAGISKWPRSERPGGRKQGSIMGTRIWGQGAGKNKIGPTQSLPTFL